MTFDISTLFTTLSYSKFKLRLKDIVTESYRTKSGKRRYSYIVVYGLNAYFVKYHNISKTKGTKDDIVNMINSLSDNIFIEFGGRVFQQTVGIPTGTNYALRFSDLFLHSYKAEFIQDCLRKGQTK